METERFSIPEVLFNPSDVGINQVMKPPPPLLSDYSLPILLKIFKEQMYMLRELEHASKGRNQSLNI